MDHVGRRSLTLLAESTCYSFADASVCAALLVGCGFPLRSAPHAWLRQRVDGLGGERALRTRHALETLSAAMPKGPLEVRRFTGSSWIAAALSGLLLGALFRRSPDALLPWLALVPLIWSVAESGAVRRFALGWLCGTLSWLVSIPWIAHTLENYGALPRPLALGGLVLLAAYLGSYVGCFALVLRRLDRRRVLVLAPALWIALEWVRSWAITGFPWNELGTALVAVPGALGASALVGVAGLSGVVVAVNVAMAQVALRRGKPRAVLVVGGAVAAILAIGLVVPSSRWTTPVAESASPVVLVQPNIATVATVDGNRALESYVGLVELMEEACTQLDGSRAGLVVLPESATWPYDLSRHQMVGRDVQRLVAAGCDVLLNGAPREVVAVPNGEAESALYNAAWLLEDGREQIYRKMHLVPFGEFVPFASIFGSDGLARNAGSFSPGRQLELFEWEGERLGVSICFEIVFAREVAARVDRGATTLVTITNDGWYGDSWAPHQHLRAARFRAAELGRPVLRAAITGISAVIDADGVVEGSLGVGERGILETVTQGRRGETPFAKSPRLVLYAALICLGFGVVFSRRRPGLRMAANRPSATQDETAAS